MPTATVSRGSILRDTSAVTFDGARVYLSDFRGHRNIVLIFADAATAPLLRDLGSANSELSEEQATVLSATDEQARQAYGVKQGAVFIADRWGEVYFVATIPPERLPGVAEILDWLRFINSQCPE